MKETFVIATNNPHKLEEISEILGSIGAEAVGQKEAGISVDPEETGSTFEENALIKARAACRASGLPAIADDSGLEVKALSGAPGIYSNRWCQGDRIAFLLSKLQGVEDRRARFTACAACVFPNGEETVVRGECRGKITLEPHGTGGFGYDPVFMPDGFDKTFGELPAEVKNSISHRANALSKLVIKLKERDNADG